MIYHDPTYVIDSLVLDKEEVPRYLLERIGGFYNISATVSNIQASFSTIRARCLFVFSAPTASPTPTASPLSNYNLINYILFADLLQVYEQYIKYFSSSVPPCPLCR